MLRSWTTSFEVNGQWYDMDNAIYMRARRELGETFTNAKIVAKLRELGYRFEANSPPNKFITVR